MSKEKQFTLCSNDKDKLKFNIWFRLENDGKITAEAREKNQSSKIYRYSFTKEEFIEKTGILLKDQERILKEIFSSFLSNKASFTLKNSQFILSLSIFNGSFEFQLPIPLLKTNNKALNQVSSKISHLIILSEQYQRLIRKLMVNFSKNKAVQLLQKSRNENLTSSALNNALNQYSEKIIQKLASIEVTINQVHQNTIPNFPKYGKKSKKISKEPRYEIISKPSLPPDNELNSSRAKMENSKLSKTITFKEKAILHVNSLCFLKDGRLVSCGDKDPESSFYDYNNVFYPWSDVYKSSSNMKGSIVIYKLSNYASDIIICDYKEVVSVCGLKNGNLASSSSNTIKIWEIDGNKCRCIESVCLQSDCINKVIELNDGKLCACFNTLGIFEWKLEQQFSKPSKYRLKYIKTLEDGEKNENANEKSRESVYVSSNSYNCMMTQGKCVNKVISILEINNYIVSAFSGEDNNLKIWDKSTYEFVKTVLNISCRKQDALVKISDDKIIIGGDGVLYTVNILTFESKSFESKELRYIDSICALRDSRVLLGNGEGMIICLDNDSNKIIFKTLAHSGGGVSCLIENKYNKIFSSCEDGNINVYDYLQEEDEEKE